jgi:hypothetical protein
MELPCRMSIFCVHQSLVDVTIPICCGGTLAVGRVGGNAGGYDECGHWPGPSGSAHLGAGVNVVMGTGFYKDAWLPPVVHEMSVDGMARFMVKEITEGVDATGIRAGVIGEVGVSLSITPTEERMLVSFGASAP